MARKGSVIIDRESCKACYLCVRACPFKVLEPDTKANSVGLYPSNPARPEACTACGSCFQVCPDCCIEVYEIKEGS